LFVNNMENHKTLSLGERLYLLRKLYGRILTILDAACGEKLLIPDPLLNRYYVSLCLAIEQLLECRDLSELKKDYRRPFESLYEIDYVDWEYDGRPYVFSLMGRIEELLILNGQNTYDGSEFDDILREVDQGIEKYRIEKEKAEARYIEGLKKGVEEYMAEVGEFKLAELAEEKSIPQKEILPDNQFRFVKDDILKRLILRDYEELKKVYDIGASKSVMVLSGGILESLLIHASSLQEKDAKFDYYQKYLEAKYKNKKPPNIEEWEFYRLIEISAQRKIVSPDIKKMAYTIEGYRNLIHLKAEIRDKLSVDKNVATSVVHLLLKLLMAFRNGLKIVILSLDSFLIADFLIVRGES
jgi:hypothetical protein